MDLLIDTNVALDFILKREKFAIADELFLIAHERAFSTCVIATSVTNAFYIMRKQKKDIDIYTLLRNMFSIVEVINVTKDDIFDAYAMRWRDFEDSVQMAVAYNCGMDCVITNNKKDFEEALVPVMTPEEFCASYRE